MGTFSVYERNRRAAQAGWIDPGANAHHCVPPRTYAGNSGPGARWQCRERSCLLVWTAVGMGVAHDMEDWPSGKAVEPVFSVDKWILEMEQYERAVKLLGSPEAVQAEMAMYDWVPAADKILGLLSDYLSNRSSYGQ